jgi:hypothetical protein
MPAISAGTIVMLRALVGLFAYSPSAGGCGVAGEPQVHPILVGIAE